MTFTQEQKHELGKPLDPRHVVKPSGQYGPKGDYIEGWHAIAEANRIFGFDGWSYTIELSRDDLSKADGKDQWQAAYTCICTVTVGSVVRQDVGFGSGFAKQLGDAIEGATKEAVTDALKRALRTFGNPFGLALYDKSRANVQHVPDQTEIDGLIASIMQLVPASGTSVQSIVEGYKVSALTELTPKQMQSTIAALRKRINDNSEQKAA